MLVDGIVIWSLFCCTERLLVVKWRISLISLRKIGNAFAYVATRALIIIKWLIFVTQRRTLLGKIINYFAYIVAVVIIPGVIVLIIGSIFSPFWDPRTSPIPPAIPTITPSPTPPLEPTPTLEPATPMPTEEAEQQTLSTVTPSNITPSPPFILLEEDFENCQDLTSKFEVDGGWLCVNGVYEANNFDESRPSGWANINFISSEGWSNYAVEYRVRILKFKPNPDIFQVALAIRRDPTIFDESKGTDYTHVLSLAEKQMKLIYSEKGGWSELCYVDKEDFRTEQWYLFRVQAQGNRIQVLRDGQMIIDTEDNRLTQGYIRLSVTPGTHAQLDNIRVYELSSNAAINSTQVCPTG